MGRRSLRNEEEVRIRGMPENRSQKGQMEIDRSEDEGMQEADELNNEMKSDQVGVEEGRLIDSWDWVWVWV